MSSPDTDVAVINSNTTNHPLTLVYCHCTDTREFDPNSLQVKRCVLDMYASAFRTRVVVSIQMGKRACFDFELQITRQVNSHQSTMATPNDSLPCTGEVIAAYLCHQYKRPTWLTMPGMRFPAH